MFKSISQGSADEMAAGVAATGATAPEFCPDLGVSSGFLEVSSLEAADVEVAPGMMTKSGLVVTELLSSLSTLPASSMDWVWLDVDPAWSEVVLTFRMGDGSLGLLSEDLEREDDAPPSPSGDRSSTTSWLSGLTCLAHSSVASSALCWLMVARRGSSVPVATPESLNRD